MSAPIIFLDFDGVLNSWEFVKRAMGHHKKYDTQGVIGLDEQAVQRLHRLCVETGARVVVSSSWRLIHDLDELRGFLGAKGFPREWVIDVTPSCYTDEGEVHPYPCRGSEIAAWLDAHLYVDRYAIIDDDSDMGEVAHRHVKTEFAWGLRDEHCERMAAMLRGDA